MHVVSTVLRLSTAAAMALMAVSASGQQNSFSFSCQSVGSSPPEPLGDREGHSISSGEISCRAEGGPLVGGVLTGTNVYEWEKGAGVLLAGSGIIRKPGATTAYRVNEGKIALIVTDGKVTGTTGSGKGVYTLASGSAATLAGKSFTYATRPTAPGQFAIDVKVD
ncbi:hypothetical protein WKW79_18960 [Variovorax robiniae]|uniref:Uncharacterized protein n=1 Tax=Variovorax robiniae TaxID=1836199 RepID=A0ABU8XA52_9BURK